MSKAYPSNLSLEQYKLISDLIPEAKPGGRTGEVDMWSVLNAIFYILVESVRWRSLPGDFPPWQTVYTYFRNWRKDGTWLLIHDTLRDWTRIEMERHKSPSEAIIDSQSVKSAAMVSRDVGFDGGKNIINNFHSHVRQRLIISKIASVSKRMRGCVWSSNGRFKQQTSRYIVYSLAIVFIYWNYI